MKALISILCLGSGMLAASAMADDTDKAVGGRYSPVTIRGCLLAGTQPDTFVLKNVTDSTGQAADLIYWLSSTRGLKDHVGHTIEVTGPVVAVSTGEVEVKTDPAKSPDTTIEVKARGKEAKARTNDEAAIGSDTRTKEERTLPVHRIKVRSLRMVAPTCS